MVNYFKTLLPVTTVVDDLFVPGKVNPRFHEHHRFYMLGFHCVEWMKLFCLVTVLYCASIFENLFEEAMFVKVDFFESARKYRGIEDIFFDWDLNNFTFDLAVVAGVMLSISALFALTMITGLAHLLIPLQVILLGTFHYALEKMMKMSRENIIIIREYFSRIDETNFNRHLDNYSQRDVKRLFEISVNPVYEPIVRNGILVGIMSVTIALEYFVERAMQYYSYDRFLTLLNRPVIIAYRKWKFMRMMKKRRVHQKARIVRRHRNVNGNYTWNCGAVRDWSMHTAIAPDDGDGDSLRTAIELDENETAYKELMARKEAVQKNKSCNF